MSTTAEKLQSDMIVAMKGKDQLKLSVIRMAKTAIKNKEIEKRVDLISLHATLTEDEVQAILATMVKQRKDSIQQFTDGDRSDLALKEAGEIDILELYMPQEIGKDAIAGIVKAAVGIFESDNDRKVTPKDMGVIMKAVQAIVKLRNERADGKLVSQLVKEALA